MRTPLLAVGFASFAIVRAGEQLRRASRKSNRSGSSFDGHSMDCWSDPMDIVTTGMLNNLLGAPEALRLPAGAPKRVCSITLQNHGDAVWSRDIKIRQLQ